MKLMNRKTEDHSVLAILYDEYRRTYPKSNESLRREIEQLYQALYHRPLDNADEITAVFVGICDDRSRYTYEDGIKTGVLLALDLELDSAMFGGGCDVSDC